MRLRNEIRAAVCPGECWRPVVLNQKIAYLVDPSVPLRYQIVIRKYVAESVIKLPHLAHAMTRGNGCQMHATRMNRQYCCLQELRYNAAAATKAAAGQKNPLAGEIFLNLYPVSRECTNNNFVEASLWHIRQYSTSHQHSPLAPGRLDRRRRLKPQLQPAPPARQRSSQAIMMHDQEQPEAGYSTVRYARRLIEACLDPLMMISPEGKITDVNQAAEQATGRKRAELIGSDFSDHFAEPDKAHAGYLEAFAKGLLRNYPLTLRHTSGRLTEALYNASLYRSDQGDVEGMLAVARDITERKQAENRINELNHNLELQTAQCSARLEAVNKELEAFTYSVSHDLRAPLRAIDGFSRILQEDYDTALDDEGKRLLGVVRENAARMTQLIDDILKFSRSGRLEIVLTEIDMAELARSAFNELGPFADTPRLQLEIGAMPAVQGDRNMLRQVFVNLLSNAIKFSRSREIAQIRVSGEIRDNEAVYSVQDNGVGFDMQYADKLFGVFQRLHGITEFEGTGIGLAIVKRIVNRHGGRVWAKGETGNGATFHFSIPLPPATQATGEPA